MTALSAARVQSLSEGTLDYDYPVAASTTIYEGGLVCYDADGYLIPAADTVNISIAGVALETIDNSSGSDGDLNCKVRRGCLASFEISGSEIARTDVGLNCFAVDNQTVGDAATQTNDVKVGTVVDIKNTDAVVLVGVFSDNDA